LNSEQRREARYQRRKAARDSKKAESVKALGSFEDVFSFEHLYAAYLDSVKGVGWKASTQRYKASALANIQKTRDELVSRKFKTRGFYEFDLVERGKPRHIRSVHITERVVQRCLCDYALIPALARSFIYDNGASLKGKGYDFAVDRVTKFLVSHYRAHGSAGYALLFDFSKYFDTAQHAPVFERIDNSGLSERITTFSKYFISNFGDEGLGLGSQVSQISAVALPNNIDHYIKDVLRIKHYARYMDDGIAISESKERLQECLRELRRLCSETGIKLNEKKTQIVKLSHGFTFVKVRFRYGEHGAIIKKASYKSIKQMRQKLKTFRRWVDEGKMSREDVRASFASWLGHMERFDSYYAAQSVIRYYNTLFSGGQK
jgi:hypothetical protein